MIDVTAPAGLLPVAGRGALRECLTRALPAAEGAPAASPYPENTGWFLHELPAGAVGTAAGVALGREEFAALRASA